VAGVLGIPLLRLEFAALFNKYHGETERNLRESLKAAEVMAPCVLWIDELEKGLSVGDNDGGTSKRVLGTFLTWMAEKDAAVFIVATANEIDSLPPELVRKGRFDEIFFVDLPDQATREIIFGIHLHRRDYDKSSFDLARLAEATDGFSGAEIEQSVVSAIYAAHAQQSTLNNNHVMQEIRQTKPLSIVMSERIAALRTWARDRTVPVD
jgi:SpoVK/Ycf46/Vps4 family AAA+-type ATPase